MQFQSAFSGANFAGVPTAVYNPSTSFSTNYASTFAPNLGGFSSYYPQQYDGGLSSFGGFSFGGSTFGGFSATPQYTAQYPAATTTDLSALSGFGAFGSTAALPASFGTPAVFYNPTAAAPTLTGPSAKVIVVGNGRIHSNKRDQALEVVRKLQQESRKEKGCVAYDWSISLDDPNLLVIYECWESDADLQIHLDSEHVKTFKQQVIDVFSVDPSVRKTSISTFEDI